jgi:hypothetical protein
LHFHQALADEAAKLVVVTYSDVQKPILTFEDAIAADSFYEDRRVDLQIGTPEIAMQSADVVIEGQVSFTACIDLVNSFFFLLLEICCC